MRWLTSATPLRARLEIAPALVDAGLPEIAVDALRDHHQASPEAREIYVRALRSAASSSPQIRIELTRDILRALPNMQQGAYYDVALHDLFAFGDIDLVIAELGASGAWREEPMRSAFIYSLRQHGRSAALVQLLSAEARSASTPLQEARTSARQVAELGAVTQAEGALKVIAAREGPSGQALQDLMYLWTSHKQQADTTWFAERARVSRGASAQQWVTAVARGAGGPAAVDTIERIGRHPDAGTAGALTVLQARYLGWQGDSPRLRRALGEAAQLQLTSADASEMARLACAVGDSDLTTQLSQRIGDAANRGELKECADRFALDAARRAISSDPQVALQRYAALVEQGADLSAQDYFDYAEATAHSSNPSGAPALYQAALTKLPARDEEAPRVTFLRAAILVQLRRHDEARENLESLLAARPGNSRARIMLTEVLLDMGRYQEALAVSSGGPVRATADVPQS
jgi:tetratricopeptide (TPR) repeat protein